MAVELEALDHKNRIHGFVSDFNAAFAIAQFGTITARILVTVLQTFRF